MTIEEWLDYISRQHPQPISLGLERVLAVKQRLHQEKFCPVIIVGGTNGKGSTCAILDAILRESGYKVGLYTSPHLLHYQERARINGAFVADDAWCAAFAKIEEARVSLQNIALTFFEFGTLAVWEIFMQAEPDVVILEVGMGGRLDATNIFDADCAIVTSIALDHTEYLGLTAEEIGFEKAGIFRAGKPAICGVSQPPKRLLQYANSIGAKLQIVGQDFSWDGDRIAWRYKGVRGNYGGLSPPALRGRKQITNACCAIAALDALHEQLPTQPADIRRGLLSVRLGARCQVLPGKPSVVLDVAHNPEACMVLVENLRDMVPVAKTWAVMGILNDKDKVQVLRIMDTVVDHWVFCLLTGARATGEKEYQRALDEAAIAESKRVGILQNAADAISAVLKRASSDDRIIVFGSFLTISGVMGALRLDYLGSRQT